MLSNRTERDLGLDDNLGIVGEGVGEGGVEQGVLGLDGIEINCGRHTAVDWLHRLLEISLESLL